MIPIHFQRLLKESLRFPLLSQSQIAQAHEITAVSLVFHIQIILENQEIRQGHSEILDAHVIPDVLLSVVDQMCIRDSRRGCIRSSTTLF